MLPPPHPCYNPDHDLIKLVFSLLDDASTQVSASLAKWFLR